MIFMLAKFIFYIILLEKTSNSTPRKRPMSTVSEAPSVETKLNWISSDELSDSGTEVAMNTTSSSSTRVENELVDAINTVFSPEGKIELSIKITKNLEKENRQDTSSQRNFQGRPPFNR